MRRRWVASEGPARSIFWTFSILEPGGDSAEVETYADQAGDQHLPDERTRSRVGICVGFPLRGEHRQGQEEDDSQGQMQELFGSWFGHGYASGSPPAIPPLYQIQNKETVTPVPAVIP